MVPNEEQITTPVILSEGGPPIKPGFGLMGVRRRTPESKDPRIYHSPRGAKAFFTNMYVIFAC